MTDEKLDKYRAFFTELWEFFKSYRVKHIGNDGKEERAWDVVMQKAQELERRHADLAETRFVRNAVITVLQEMERLYRKDCDEQEQDGIHEGL